MIDQISKMIKVLDASTIKGLLGIFCLMTLSAILEMAGIGMFIPVFNLLVDPENIIKVDFISGHLNIENDLSPNSLILLLSLALFIFFAVKNIILGFIIYYQNHFVFNKFAEYSCRLMGAYLTRPYVFHLHRNTAELTRNLTTLVGKLFTKGILPLLQFVMEFLTAIGILSVMLMVNPIATIGAAILLGSAIGIFYLIVRRRIAEWGSHIIECDMQILLWINQSLGSIKETILSGRQNYFEKSFADPNYQRARYATLLNTTPNFPRLFIEVIVMAGILILIFSMVYIQGKSINATLPILGLFGVAAMRLMPAFSRMVTSMTAIKENTAALDVIYQDIKEYSERLQRPAVDQMDDSKTKKIEFKNSLRLENLSYQYPQSEGNALSNVSLTVPKGASVAIVGRSGAGKTTLVDLILGLLTPSSGKILIDDQEIFVQLPSWQKRIGYIPQEIYLIDDSLQRNIALGLTDQEIDSNKMNDAVQLAQLGGVIEDLPDGLNTLIGERGTRLSGGQKQRVGIARAVYHNPDVLVLDEATSALDSETEKEISDALTTFGDDKTVIIIAHRLSTVRHCDIVILLDQGQVKKIGGFEELIENDEDFARMVQLGALT
jgi:ATP-binding cassette, subfamily B, bacterial PglK